MKSKFVKAKMAQQYNNDLMHERAGSNLRKVNLSMNLRKEIQGGKGLTHEYNRFTKTAGMWPNTNKSST